MGSMSDSSSRLSNEEAVAIYDELERLGELSANGLPCDGSHKVLRWRLFVNSEVCPGSRPAVLQKYWITLGLSRARKGDLIAMLH